jgi:hypothetical protein
MGVNEKLGPVTSTMPEIKTMWPCEDNVSFTGLKSRPNLYVLYPFKIA